MFATGFLACYAIPWILNPAGAVCQVGGVVILLMGIVQVLRPRAAVNKAVTPRPSRCVYLALGLSAAWLMFRGPALLPDRFAADDWDYLRSATTTPLPILLWEPYNEHLCVGMRLVSWLVAKFPDPVQLLAARVAISLLFTLGLFLLTLILCRLVGPWPAVVGGIVFGWSLAHREVVSWFAASGWLIGFDLFLLAWLAVAGETPTWRRWGVAAALATLATLNYSVSVLGGILLSAYGTVRRDRRLAWLPGAAAATAVAAVALFLGSEVVERADYGGKSFVDGISVGRAAEFLGRLPFDGLLWHGLSGKLIPSPKLVAAFGTLALTWAVFCLAQGSTPRHGLETVAFWALVLPYAIVLPFRSWVSYGDLILWGRYHLWPMLGLALASAAMANWTLNVSQRGTIAGIAMLVAWALWIQVATP